MANEARDDTWDSDTKTQLRRAFEDAGQGKAELRALQCRSTRCALEYAVDARDVLHQAGAPGSTLNALRLSRVGHDSFHMFRLPISINLRGN